jgi:hypothetical protein
MKRSKTNRRRLSIQTLESRRVLAASLGWDGPGLGSATLTYNIANSPDSLSQSETNAAIETALAAWSQAADITFVPTTQRGLRDSIDISFTNIDGRGGTLAQAYFPDDVNPARIAGDIQFDISEIWEVGNSLGHRAFDLVWVAAHEIGHSLGLDHADGIASVLAPFVSPGTQFVSMAASDVAAIGQLYAAPGVDGSTEETPVDETPADDPVGDDPAGPGDGDDDPFPRRRWWWRWGSWGRFGGRLEADVPASHNLANPTDVNGDESTTALDALIIINQLSQSSSADNASADNASISGMCDTNADGAITALDALTVINAMDADDSDSETSDNMITIEEEETPSDEEIVIDEDSSEDDNIVDDSDDGETSDEEDTSNDEEMVDDGGLLDEDDEDNQGSDEDDEEDCPEGRHGHRFAGGIRGFLRGGNLESLLSRFDTTGDGALSEDEVPSFLWEKLVDRGVDADADAAVTAEEIEAALAAAKAERFAERDQSGDGLLQEDEVSARFWEKISQADTNGDAGISQDELNAWFDDRRSENTAATDFGHMLDQVDQVFRQIGRGGFRFGGRFR